MIQSKSLKICSNCYSKSLDLSKGLKHSFEDCGHTVCKECVQDSIRMQGNIFCKLCNTSPHLHNQANSTFKSDDSTRNISHLQAEKCKVHLKDIEYLCLADKEKICSDCLAFGKHRTNDHEIQRLDFLKVLVAPKIECFEDLRSKVDLFMKDTERIYEEQRTATVSMIKARFRELMFIFNVKETEFIYEINSFYDNEIDRLRKEVGENSLAKQVIDQKISEYQQITQLEDPFEILEENISNIFGIIQKAVHPEKVDKIHQVLQEIKQNLDSRLSSQISALEKVKVETEDLTFLSEEADLKLDKELSSRHELTKYTFSSNDSSNFKALESSTSSDITIMESKLSISFPFCESLSQNLDVIQGTGESISCLEFKTSKDIERISREDISLLCYIRSKFTNIQNIQILINDFEISDEALFDVFTCLFWRNEFLKKIYLQYLKEGLFEKSIFYLAKEVLDSTQSFTEFEIRFLGSTISSKAYNALSQSISKRAENLTNLTFVVNCDSDDQISLHNLFGKMPNLEYFAFWSISKAINDDALNRFNLNTLRWIKKLKHFKFFINNSSVTDLSVKKFFESFPDEWFLTLQLFQVGFLEAKITDESLEEFIDQTLSKFQNLKEFDIFTQDTSVTHHIKSKISRWKQYFTAKVKDS